MMLEVQLRQTPVISGVFWSAPKPCPMGEIQLLGGLDVRDCVLLLEAGSHWALGRLQDILWFGVGNIIV